MVNIMHRVIGNAIRSGLAKKLRGGPQSLLPLSPSKGSGIPSLKGLTPKAPRGYVAPMQNPARSPRTGGLVKPGRRR